MKGVLWHLPDAVNSTTVTETEQQSLISQKTPQLSLLVGKHRADGGSIESVGHYKELSTQGPGSLNNTTSQFLRHVYKYKITISGQIYEVIPGPMQREDKSQ